MTRSYAQTLFTPNVKALQIENGSRGAYARMDAAPGEIFERDLLGPQESTFVSMRDSFYMASTSESGWPYLQHRGGPSGFVKTLDEHTLAFADFRGNRQYISVGNLTHDDRISLFFMDYPNRARLKLLGHARQTDDPEIVAQVSDPSYKAKVERAVVIDVEAFDWNCPQHITPRFTQHDIAHAVAPLHARIAELEADLAALQSG